MEADQNRVDRLLRWGIIFSLLWLMGAGSLIAVLNGVRAKRLIEDSQGLLRGQGRVWWCIVVGGIGLAVWIPLLIVAAVNQF